MSRTSRALVPLLAGIALLWGAPAASADSIWSAASAPIQPSDPDTASVELGLKFRSDVAGTVTGVRFFKAAANTGTHTGTLWSAAGANLRTATFAGETASGWQQVTFASPVAITANTTYVVSYHAPNGRYAADADAFAAAGVDTPPLHALRSGVDGANGVYAYGAATTFPTQTWQATNYWVDVAFTPAGPDTTAPSVTTLAPAANATSVAPSTSVSATFNEDVQAATVALGLTNPSGQTVAATLAYDAPARTARLTPTVTLQSSTKYTATVSGAKDAAGNTMAPLSWSFTTAAPPGACPCTIWPDSAVPGTPRTADNSAVEVGVRFRSDVAGFVTGLRFYKGVGNGGTHVGHLWTNTGTLLATATFTGESASGWQTVTLPNPVAIAANTTYVASYYAPAGGYASDQSFFTATGADAAPLHALQDGVSGANGLYAYGASAFPTSTFRASNYWVDVVFNQTASDTTAPSVTGRTPAPGSTAAPVSTAITATFSEPVQPSTVSWSVSGPGGAVAGTTSYADTTAGFTPASPLANQTTYTVTVSGAKDAAGNTMSPVSWSFTTAAPAPPPPSEGPGGPILLVTSSANRFTSYYAEILRAEGLNEFDTVDVSAFSAASLAGHHVVLLGETPVSASQVAALTTFVNAGGNLIAMRPDAQLAGLLGITRATGTLGDAYLGVNTSNEAAAGITAATMQFHGTADRYTLSGASTVATLYSSATAATTNPAVSLRTAGTGQAAAFTYDLARSVVSTRQGNPAWAGLERDGSAPIRSDDLYFGGSQTDWVNLSKVAIPQADEQQRLLANLVETMSRRTMPLPRLWYFPNSYKAVIVGTGDDHASGGTAGRFDQYLANSSAGCSVAAWTCLRFTSYVYPTTPLSNSAAAGYVNQGFELGLHPTTNCSDFTAASLASVFSSQLSQWASKYTSLTRPQTNRTHCLVWSTWAGEPRTELANGIRFDANYYYWPGSWINNRPGFMTGSGMPMRFADTDGTLIDVYQATTQMTDESGQSYPFTPNTLLDQALGANGYYGAFTVNMHTDRAQTPEDDALIASARARNVPIVSSKQMLTWLDGRNASAFKNLAWSGDTLSFSVATGAGADGLTVLLPTAGSTGRLSSLVRGGAPATYRTETIKGLEYAIFTASTGTYQARYAASPAAPEPLTAPAGGGGAGALASAASIGRAGGLVAPRASGVAAHALPDGSATVQWRTDRAAKGTVRFGTSARALRSERYGYGARRAHTVMLTRLAPGRRYFYRVVSRGAGGKVSMSPVRHFDTPAFGVADARLAQFRTGSSVGVAVRAVGDGELRLAAGRRAGMFTSRLLDAGQLVAWRTAQWRGSGPIEVSVRTGSDSGSMRSWSRWTRVRNGAALTGLAASRYLQYRVRMTARPGARPTLEEIGFTSTGSAVAPIGETGQ